MRKQIGVMLVSAATLLLEIAYTRLLSVSHWHHFAFLVIGTALLGFGLSGALLSALAGRLERHPEGPAAAFAVLFAASAPASLIAANAVGFEEILFAFELPQLCRFLLFYLIFAIPFFFAGCAIGGIIVAEAGRIGRIYASSLSGSAAGCVGIFILLPLLGGLGTVFLCAFLGIAGAIVLTGGKRSARDAMMLGMTSAAFVVLLLLPSPFELRVSQFKALRYFLSLPDGKILTTRWNAICRTDVASSRFIRIPPAGLSLNVKGDIPPQVAFTSDADSPSPITDVDADAKNLSFAGACLQALPYRMGRTGSVLIIGAGGGLDVLTALACGAERIDALEINPDVIDLVTGPYAAFSRDLFARPAVALIRAEGRNFLRRGAGRYDVIQIPLFDSVAASSAGVHAFSESYLYTVESFRDCLKKLTPRGMLCVTRWIKYPPRESLRLLGTGISALDAEGALAPAANVALVRSWSTITLLVSPSVLGHDDVKALKEFCDEMGFDPVYFPGITPSDANRHTRLGDDLYFKLASRMIGSDDRARLFRDYIFDISPATDDRPFFYHSVRFRALPHLWKTMGREWVPFAEWGELVLYAALVQSGLIAACLFLLATLFLRSRGHAGCGPAHPRMLAYFFLLGLAFIAVELCFMQKLVLFLGHPSSAMGVVLCVLLLVAGLGSRASDRVAGRGPLLALCMILLIYAVGLSPLLDRLIGIPFAGRIAAAALLVAAPALLMGTAFPLGIRAARSLDPRIIPWGWAVNGASSVFGAALSVCAALFVGFNLVLCAAALLYLAAAVILPRYRAPAPSIIERSTAMCYAAGDESPRPPCHSMPLPRSQSPR